MDFELKLEKPDASRAWVSAFVMGISYFFGGLIPMIPYFAFHNIDHALFTSIGITGCVLVVFGFVKSIVTGGTNAMLSQARSRHWRLVRSQLAQVTGSFAVSMRYTHYRRRIKRDLLIKSRSKRRYERVPCRCARISGSRGKGRCIRAERRIKLSPMTISSDSEESLFFSTIKSSSKSSGIRLFFLNALETNTGANFACMKCADSHYRL